MPRPRDGSPSIVLCPNTRGRSEGLANRHSGHNRKHPTASRSQNPAVCKPVEFKSNFFFSDLETNGGKEELFRGL